MQHFILKFSAICFLFHNIVFAQTNYGGVGLVLDHAANGQGIYIREVTYKSPADKQRIQKGLFVTSVDGQNIQGMTLVQVVQLIRGPVGSEVQLGLYNPQFNKSFSATLVRKSLREGPASWSAPSSWVSEGLTKSEIESIKLVIAGLKDEVSRQKMKILLQAFKSKKISKVKLFQVLKSEF